MRSVSWALTCLTVAYVTKEVNPSLTEQLKLMGLIQYKDTILPVSEIPLRSSDLHNRISNTGKMTPLYWIRPQVTFLSDLVLCCLSVSSPPALAYPYRAVLDPRPGQSPATSNRSVAFSELHTHINKRDTTDCKPMAPPGRPPASPVKPGPGQLDEGPAGSGNGTRELVE